MKVIQLKDEKFIGESFGENSLVVENVKRSSTCICMEITECLFISKNVFDRCVKGENTKIFK